MLSNKVQARWYIVKLLKEYKGQLCIVAAALLMVSLSILAMGYFLKQLVDQGLVLQNLHQIYKYIYQLLLAIICFAVGSFYRSYFINRIALNITNKLRQDSYQNLLQLPLVQFEQLKIGDIITRLTSDLDAVNNLIINFLSFFVRNSIMLLGASTLMFFYSTKLSLIVILGLPILLLPMLKFAKRVRALSKIILQMQSEITVALEETLTGIRAVHAYNQQQYQQQRFSSQLSLYLTENAKRLQMRSLFFATAIGVIAIAIIGVIFVGSLDIIKGNMSSGTMVSFIYYAVLVGSSSAGIAEMLSNFTNPLLALERIVDLQNLDYKNYPPPLAPKQLEPIDLTINFADVKFAYPTRPNIQILSGLDLTIAPGKFVGIVGKSGAGKSTLLQLLMKFYAPTSGTISLGKYAINDLTDQDLRQYIAYVEQSPTIFSGTIYENIVFANPQASEAEIMQVAEICGITNFAGSLDSGLNAVIGQRGVRLSGGQRQRLAIARALLYKPQILLLDEASSALDNESEQQLLANVRRLLPDQTIILIAHRLSSIEHADQIVVINDGRVQNIGSHQWLLRHCPIYQTLQTQEFLK